MSLLQIQPLPTPEVYYREFSKVETLAEEKGGLAIEIARRALEVSVFEEIAEEEQQIVRHGMYMVDDDADPDDPDTYKPCYAYVDGYRVAEKVMRQIYTSPFSFSDWFSVAEKWRENALSQNLELMENPIFKQRTTSPMMQLGVRGLILTGEDTFAVIRRLSEQLYSEDEDLAEIYQLGSGVMIESAALRQRAVNHELLSIIEQNSDFDSEAEKFFGESDA